MHDNLLMSVSVQLCLLHIQKCVIVLFKLYQERMVPVVHVFVCVTFGEVEG
jgi:hypothetical protein